MITMRHKIEIYVPSNTLIDVVFVKKTAKTFAKLFGGATTIDAFRTLVDDNGVAIPDKIQIVYAYSEKLPNKLKHHLRAFAAMIAQQLNQDVVLLVMDGIAELIPSTESGGDQHGLQNA